jgi:hypothetical protein
MAESVNPAGIAPADLAAMSTSVQQSAGGTQSAATGAGGLMATRTRNAGAPMAAIAKSARTGGELASEGALGIQLKNAAMKQGQKDSARAGLGQMYGINAGNSVDALGKVASNVDADVAAKNASWNWTKGVSSIADLMSAGAGGYRSIMPGKKG